ncbi:MAG: acyltransferase domain-containing protein, partial [Phormidesmis sp.]
TDVNAESAAKNGSQTDVVSPCAIGSVKTNIGHLDAASGISGFIKTVLALKHQQIPASLHFQQPNPNIDFSNSPFYVNAALADWPQGNSARRAGVSSFGIGGTNAHIVLEEAPSPKIAPPNEQPQLLVLSAKSPTALDIAAVNLADYLDKANRLSEVCLADVAYTLQVGRKAHEYRRSIVCQSAPEAIDKLHVQSSFKVLEQPSLVFLFSGQGSQYANMAKGLYETQPVFKQTLDQCAEILSAEGIGLLAQLSSEISSTALVQPILFAVEYALAQLWLNWKLHPTAMLGHSLGEYVAACLSGVFDLATALKLTTLRGKLMQQMPQGAMLSVALSVEAVEQWLNDDVVLAVNNGPHRCVVSGTDGATATLQSHLEQNKINCHLLHTSHAFHSPMMEPIISPFVEAISKVKLHPPTIPFISNVTGTWITTQEATSPDYWGAQIRQSVRFSEGITTLSQLANPVFLEIGPGDSLAKLTQQQLSVTESANNSTLTVHSLPHPKSETTDTLQILSALGQLWCAGVEIDWQTVHTEQARRRIPLPTYPFERKRYWVDLDTTALTGRDRPQSTGHIELKPNLSDWFYSPSWERKLPKPKAIDLTERPRWLIFADNKGVGQQLAQSIEKTGQDVFTVLVGDVFEQSGYREFRLNPKNAETFKQLLEDLRLREVMPTEIVYLWPISTADEPPDEPPDEPQSTALFLTFLSLLKAVSIQVSFFQITVVTEATCEVVGNESLIPERAEIQGLCQVVGQEYPAIGCRQVDWISAEHTPKQMAQLLWQELQAESPSAVVAYRGSRTAQANSALGSRLRWQQTYQNVHLSGKGSSAVSGNGIRLQEKGLYVIVGTDGLSQIWRDRLIKHYQANVVLIKATEISALQTALKQAEDEFGAISGVLVASPMTNEQSAAPIALLQPHHWEYNCETKKTVLQNLAIALQDHAPDFCCVQSSLSSVIGGLGLAAYAGANHFIDAFVTQQNQSSTFPWFSINWDAHAPAEDTPQTGWGSALADFALTPEEIWQATERILTQAVPGQTIVSKGDLLARYRQWIHATPQKTSAQSTQASSLNQTEQHHHRPQLATTYLAPRTEVEETIAGIWQDLLGLEKVGIHDSFFDLGGHSLMAIQVISRLREAFPVEIEMRNLLFEAPTVAKIAAIIAEQLPKDSEMDEMAALLAEVQTLSSKEINAQLAGGDA